MDIESHLLYLFCIIYLLNGHQEDMKHIKTGCLEEGAAFEPGISGIQRIYVINQLVLEAKETTNWNLRIKEGANFQ